MGRQSSRASGGRGGGPPIGAPLAPRPSSTMPGHMDGPAGRRNRTPEGGGPPKAGCVCASTGKDKELPIRLWACATAAAQRQAATRPVGGFSAGQSNMALSRPPYLSHKTDSPKNQRVTSRMLRPFFFTVYGVTKPTPQKTKG